MAPLLARTWALDPDQVPDLLRLAGEDGVLFAREGRGFAGRGVAQRVGRAQVEGALVGIELDDPLDRPGTGPVAFAALPFLPDAPTELVVPELLVGIDAEGGWATLVGPADEVADADPIAAVAEAVAAGGRPSPADGPSSFHVEASRPPADWQAAVARATARIRAGELDKVVLAREVVVRADADLSIATLLLRLSQHHPACYLYLVDGYCGASPELLVARHDDVVTAQPMAGTKPRRGDPDADAVLAAELLASPTYRREHQVTIDVVHDTLLGFSSYVDYEPEPSVVPLANVVHLATRVEGRLSHPPASILELVSALHPTPAVCGRPREAALAVIAELEELDRGRYAGAVGWVDRRGNGAFAVGIRGAEVRGPTARVIAGNGMVGDSDPPTELIETRAKLQAMLSAIVRP
ncbi:MAG: isochorismate synthase [Acidimicrobiales bacterium]|nr:isochorismate synthase [Acidimicrobiales bacterium]HRW38871.1 isochorismate synthase [Aquihabitans sp.]